MSCHNLPLIVNVEPMSDRTVALNTLLSIEKKQVWHGIKQQNPALADMMQNDENLKIVRATFDAVFVMTPEDISSYKG